MAGITRAESGEVAGRNFRVTQGGPGRFNTLNLGPLLEVVHDRLAGVVIERLPWASFLDRYDRPDTPF